jgi:hypothetical protein
LGRWYSTARVSKRPSHKSAACLRGRYCTNLTCSGLTNAKKLSLQNNETRREKIGAFGIGFGAIFIVVPTQTLMQQETPIELVGRVSSSFMSILSVSQLLGLIISGSLTQRMGIRNLFLASAAMLVLFACFGYLRLPAKANAATAES